MWTHGDVYQFAATSGIHDEHSLVAAQKLQCSSLLGMTYLLLRDYNILPKKELHWSLWVAHIAEIWGSTSPNSRGSGSQDLHSEAHARAAGTVAGLYLGLVTVIIMSSWGMI